MAESKNCINLQIKVYPEEKARFLKIKDEMDEIIKTDRDAFLSLMDFYENPKEIKVDNPELIKKNQELADEIDELQDVNAQLKQKIEELNIRIEEITNSGNDNAMAAQRLQLELEAAHEEIARLKETDAARANRPANIFEVEVHPVAFHFLKKMSEYLSAQKKTEITPGYILTDLFLKDLQNPRANNLPYIVTTAEISKVLEEYRKAHPEEK